MKITKNTVVTVWYKLSDAQNVVLDEGQDIVYLHGNYDDTLPALEKALDGQEIGYKTKIQIEPEEAFGEYDPDLLRLEDADKFPQDIAVGMQFEATPEESADNSEENLLFTVTDIVDGKVILDGNHPLAGMALRFELEVKDVRKATEEEIKRGYMNGPLVESIDEDGQYRSMFVH